MSMSDIDLDDSTLAKQLHTQSSTSTIGSVTSASSVTQKPSKKEKIAAKKRSVKEKKKEKEKIKKFQNNKIGKDDFYRKHTEFRTWLFEEKKVKFEDISLAKAKDHFKKFMKKWNSDKLPKCYYRGIDVCWQEGSPATQVSWAQPSPVAATPGSLHEEVLDQKYSRKSSFGTFGKRAGRKAVKELQMAQKELEGSPEFPNKKSNSAAPPTATIKRHGKLRPVSMMFAPPPPPLRLNSQLSASQPSFPAIFGQSPSLKMSALDISDQPDHKSDSVCKAPVIEQESSPRSLRNRKRPSSGSLTENEQKMAKQDSYTQRLQSTSQAMFGTSSASSRQQPDLPMCYQAPSITSDNKENILGDNRESDYKGDNKKVRSSARKKCENSCKVVKNKSRAAKVCNDDNTTCIPDYENNVHNTICNIEISEGNLQMKTVTQARSLDEYMAVSSKYGRKSQSTAI